MISNQSKARLFSLGIFLVLTLVLLGTTVQAASWQQSVKIFNTEHGLPSGSFRDILHANDKTVWLATTDGLARFDGTRAEVFRHQRDNPNSLPSSDIYSLTEDAQGRIWIGANSRLSYYDIQLNRFITITPEQKCDISIKYITKDGNDVIWGISESGVLLKHDPQKQVTRCYTTEQRLERKSNLMLSSLFYDERKNVIWLTTELGLERFDIAKSQSLLIDDFYNDKPFSLSGGFVDRQGNVWVGSDANGIVKIDGKSDKLNHYSPTEHPLLTGLTIVHGADTDEDELWFAANIGGLLRFSNGRFNQFNGVDPTLDNAKLSYASYLRTDKYNNLWIATSNSVAVLSESARAIRFVTVEQMIKPVSETAVTSLSIDNNNQLYASTPQGIYQADFDRPPEVALTRVDKSALTSNAFSKIHHADNGLYYLCSSALPYVLDTSLTQFTELTGDSQLSLCVDFQSSHSDPNRLWVISHNIGLVSLDKRTNTFKKVHYKGQQNITSFSKRLMHAIPEHQGKFWFTSADNGFARLDTQSFELHSYQHDPDNKNSLVSNFVIGIAKGKDDIIWLSTIAGLSRFDITDERFINFHKEDGLSSELLNKILFDNDGQMWISSQDGLNLMDPVSYEIKRFYRSNGLLSNLFSMNSAVKDQQGKLIFGGPAGVTKIDPDKLKHANSQFDTFIATVKVDKQTYRTLPTAQLALEMAPRDIVIDYGITAYASAGSNEFRYQLKGYDDSWRETTRNTSATYSNLPYGSYTFAVQGKTQAGDWTNQTETFAFSIPAPWYLTPWAFVGYLVLLVILIKLLGLYLTKAEKEKARLLQEKVDQQTISLQQSHEKITNLYQRQQWLFAQLSHEIRTPVTLMLAPLTKLLKSHDPTHQQTLAVAQYNQTRLVKMLDQLLEIAQSGNLTEAQKQVVDVSSTLAWITNAIKPLLEQKQQQLIVDIQSPGTVLVTQDALEKILLNLLSNAHKYTDPKGTITLSAQLVQGKVSISVADNGRGIEPADQKLIFECFERANIDPDLQGVGVGLAVVKQLLAVNDGEITLNSKLGKGSKFVISLPCAKSDITTTQFSPSKTVETLTEHMLVDEGNTNLPDLRSQDDDITTAKPTILLAEDHSQMRHYISELLHDDYQVVTAENGQLALTQAIETVPDIILSDVMMPIMDGYQLLEQLKNHPVTNHIPVLMLTAKDDPASRIKGLTLKADDYIAKPFNADELSLKLHNVLHLQKMWHLKYQTQKDNETQPNQQPQPESAVTVQLNDTQQKLMEAFEQICLENYQDTQFKLTDMAKKVNMTERQLQRKLKAISGLTPVQILRDIRLRQAKTLIENGEQITQVAYSCGFSGYDYFSRSFKEKYQITPKECQESVK